MAAVDFSVPLKPEDLLGDEGSYQVQEVEDGLHLLDDIVDRLCDNALNITENEVFDCLYSLVRSFPDLSEPVRSRVFDVLLSGLSCLSLNIDLLAQKAADAPGLTSEVRTARSALSMHVFLLKWIATLAEKHAGDVIPGQENKVAARKGGKAATKKGAATRIVESWNWDQQRPKLLNTFRNVLQGDLWVLWRPNPPDETFVAAFISVAFLALASPTGAKDKDTRAGASAIATRCVSALAQQINVATAVMSLLQNHLHASLPAAELVAAASAGGSVNETAFVAEVMNEIGRLPMAELSRDAGLSKNFAAFITDLSELAPSVVLSHMSVLHPHLQQGESYTMRNALLHAIGNALVELGAMVRRERTETAVKARESLFEIMRARVHDVNAFTRSKVLQVWAMLSEKDSIPTKMQPQVIQIAAERLEDKSGQVRKSAVQLLKILVQKNPYAPTLPLSFFKAKLEDSQKQLSDKEEAAALAANVVAPGAEAEAEDGEEKPEGGEEGEEKKVKAEKGEGEEGEEGGEGVKAEGQGEGMKEEQEQSEEAKALNKEVDELQSRVSFYQAVVAFVGTVHKAVATIEGLLRSSTTTDVVEAMHFLVAVYGFQMEVAQQSLRKMLLLIWSKEPSIKEAVTEAYRTIFLVPLEAARGSKEALAETATRLASLVQGGNIGELASLEQVMLQLAGSGHLPDALVLTLWDNFMRGDHSAGALVSLSAAHPSLSNLLAGPLKKVLLSAELPVLLRHPMRARCLCDIAAAVPLEPALRPRLAQVLSEVVMHGGGGDDERWLPATEAALNAMAVALPEAHVAYGSVLRAMASHLFSAPGDEVESWRLARFLHVLGHSAVKQLAVAEGMGADQQRKQAAEEEAQAKSGAKDKPKKNKDEEEGIEAATGVDAVVQETRAEMARELGERDLLSEESLVGMFGAMVRSVCENASNKYSDSRVRTAGVLALCKLMCVSSVYCEENLQLLFSIMMTAPERAIRSNTVVALGDMAFRWTNLTEPWMSHIFALLRDADAIVRHNTLTVLTHLVLNDMVKVRGQVSEMALCLEDSEHRIQDMARLFFSEFKLKQQGMLIYNLLPDLVGRLSASQVEEGKFRRVIKSVFAFIDKAKQTDGLVDKFCSRFRASDDPRQWRDMAFCLANLNLSDKGVRRLCDDANFKAFADKLHDEDIAGSFLQIVAKAKKLPKAADSKADAAGGGDGKSAADELEEKLDQAMQSEEARAAALAARIASGEVIPEGDEGEEEAPAPAPFAKKATAKKAPAKAKAAKKKKVESEDEESEAEEAGEDEEDEAPARKALAASNRKSGASRPAAKGKPKKIASDDEDEEDEENAENVDTNSKRSSQAAAKPSAASRSRNARVSRA